MSTEWSGVVTTTTARYLKGAADLTIRDRLWLAWLNRKRRITYNWSGDEVKWQVKFSLPEVVPYSGGIIDFEPSDPYRQLTLGWRGYVVSDTMTERERLMNRGNEALIRRYGEIMKNNRRALDNQLGTEVYVDGNATGYTSRMHGIESFCAAGGTCAVTDKIAVPDDTYAGKSTKLGAEAGTWSSDLTTSPNAVQATDWPSGKGDPEYDYMAPRLMNYDSTAWGTGAQTWLANCDRVIRQANLWTRLNAGPDGRADVVLLAEDMFYDYMNKIEAKSRINLKPTPQVLEMGFDGAQQEGVSIVTEFGVPASTGYLLNFDQMEMRCMYGELYMSKGPEMDINTLSYKYLMAYYGNLCFQPKFFSKIADFVA